MGMIIIGQEHIINDLEIQVDASRKKNEPLPHVMLFGPAGHGKTTIAKYVASLMGFDQDRFKKIQTVGNEITSIDEVIDLAYLLKRDDIVFIDEIHAIGRTARDAFYGMLEEFYYPGIHVFPFTCVGATTDFSRLPTPLRDRFQLQYRVKPYETEHIEKILELNGCPKDVAVVIAQRTRNVPRISKNFLLRIQNEALSTNNGVITEQVALDCFNRSGINHLGMDDIDRRIINLLYEEQAFRRKNAVGIKALCDQLDLDPRDYKVMYEPFLVRIKMVGITGRGRILTQEGKEFLEENYK